MAANVSTAVAAIITVVFISIFLLLLLVGVILLNQRVKSMMRSKLLSAIKKRRNFLDSFREKNGYSWDYMMAFKVYDSEEPISESQRQYSMQYILRQLSAGGLEIRLFYSIQHKEVYCKIRCPLNRLQRHADLVNQKLLLDKEALSALCKQGREGKWSPLEIPETSPATTIDPYSFIYAKYEFDCEKNRTNENMFHLYKKWPTTVIKNEKDVLSTLALSEKSTSFTQNPINTINESRPVSTTTTAQSIATKNEPIDYASEAAIFRGCDRLKLIHSIINYFGPGGCKLDMTELQRSGCVLCYTPLHDLVELRSLEEKWIQFFQAPWHQPIDDIKNYFGEKIGLYFVWLGQYTTWLTVASAVGVGVWIDIADEGNNPSAASIPYFAGFMAMWSALFLEFWKRREKQIAMQWGMVGFEAEELERPQFQGETILSAIDGKPKLHFPRYERSKRSILSNFSIFGLVLLVLGVIAAIFTMRIAIASTGFEIDGTQMASIIASILLAIQIQILGDFFSQVALQMTDFENYRTETEFEDALIAKTFLFQFVNSYAPLFYIAFVKPFIQDIDACIGTCMLELQTTLGTIFLSRLFLGNLLELGIPLAKTFLTSTERRNAANRSVSKEGGFGGGSIAMTNAVGSSKNSSYSAAEGGGVFNSSTPSNQPSLRSAADSDADDDMAGYEDLIDRNSQQSRSVSFTKDRAGHEISEIEKTFTLESYDAMLGTFDDYSEMVIQFGYATMFITAFPLATLMCLVNNYVEIRVDGWKLCHLCRRPEARSVEDIGTWYTIMEIVGMASVFINSAIIGFTADNTINYTWTERVWIFILMATGLFCIRLLVAYIIPDVPMEVEIQLKREEFILTKVVENREDDEGVSTSGIFLVPNYNILITDDDPL